MEVLLLVWCGGVDGGGFHSNMSVIKTMREAQTALMRYFIFSTRVYPFKIFFYVHVLVSFWPPGILFLFFSVYFMVYYWGFSHRQRTASLVHPGLGHTWSVSALTSCHLSSLKRHIFKTFLASCWLEIFLFVEFKFVTILSYQQSYLKLLTENILFLTSNSLSL